MTRQHAPTVETLWFILSVVLVSSLVTIVHAERSVPGDTTIGTWDPATNTYTLSQDVTENIVIEQGNLTFDGGGHSITGGTEPYIYLPGIAVRDKAGVTICNARVEGFYYGVEVYNCTVSAVTGVEASLNQEGIHLSQANGNAITHCVVSDNGGAGGGGIILSSSSDNTVADNTVGGNGFTQIALYSSDDNTLQDNVTSAGYAAVFVEGSGNTLTANTMTDAYMGVYVEAIGYPSSGNTISDCTMSSNAYSGIYVNGSDENTLAGNAIEGSEIGIHIAGAVGNTVTGNSVTANSARGIYVMDCDGTTVQDNAVTLNGMNGIEIVWGCTNTTVATNTSSDNAWSGVLVFDCTGAAVTGNVVRDNLQDGIVLDTTSANTVSGNEVRGNDKGIVLTDTEANVVYENTVSGNTSVNLLLNGACQLNAIYHNNFMALSREQQIWVWTFVDTSNLFNLDRPTGGNYWADWTSPDDDGDGFVDVPYTISKDGAQDELPWATENGWSVKQVDIDVKPGSLPNTVNINGSGLIPVAVLGSADFDVRKIDAASLSFAGLAVRIKNNGKAQCAIEDVNGDGYDDLVCHFVDDAESWAEGTCIATLTGNLLPEFGGIRIEGSDEIRVVP